MRAERKRARTEVGSFPTGSTGCRAASRRICRAPRGSSRDINRPSGRVSIRVRPGQADEPPTLGARVSRAGQVAGRSPAEPTTLRSPSSAGESARLRTGRSGVRLPRRPPYRRSCSKGVEPSSCSQRSGTSTGAGWGRSLGDRHHARVSCGRGRFYGCSSAGRAPVSKTGCRGFEPLRPCQSQTDARPPGTVPARRHEFLPLRLLVGRQTLNQESEVRILEGHPVWMTRAAMSNCPRAERKRARGPVRILEGSPADTERWRSGLTRRS